MLKTLRKVAQCQPGGLELGFEFRSAGSAFNAGGAADIIDLDNLVHAAHVDGDRAGKAFAHIACHSAHDRRAAAIGDERRTRLAAPVAKRGNVLAALRKGDNVGRGREVAHVNADGVRLRLAEGMQNPLVFFSWYRCAKDSAAASAAGR